MIGRVIAAALALVVVIALAWLLFRREAPTAPAATPLPSETPTATAAATPTIVAGYRLAGTALGLRGRYAVFEDPDGNTEMYKVGDEVPGLGTLARVGDIDAAVTTSAGEMRFQVRPAPTKVPENTPTVRRVRTPSPRTGRSESESSPSGEPAPPAS